jgi:hypothetical protein
MVGWGIDASHRMPGVLTWCRGRWGAVGEGMWWVKGHGTTQHDGRGQGVGVSKGKNKKKEVLTSWGINALTRGQGERGVTWHAVGEGT